MDYDHFSSESVAAGHPDKICDQISDAILDECLKADVNSHAGIECLVTSNKVVVAGEVQTKAKVDYEAIARQVIKNLGYSKKIYHFDYRSAEVEVLVHQQSPDIALGVDPGGAGDQGMMFGYATPETPQLMPLPIMLAHGLMQTVDALKKDQLPYLRPDGKSQVVVRYEQGRPAGIETVVLAVPHDPGVSKEQVRTDLTRLAVNPVLSTFKQKPIAARELILNGTGKWEIGGPHSDMGETGRKIVVDSYGGMARVGGGCFSGKDPTKVDRSGAYACRFLAKNIVAAGLADRCEVKVAYVIGQSQPIARSIETFGTAKKKLSVIKDFAFQLLDLSVDGILNTLDLRQPIYLQTATYGHFGKENLPWEKIVV